MLQIARTFLMGQFVAGICEGNNVRKMANVKKSQCIILAFIGGTGPKDLHEQLQ